MELLVFCFAVAWFIVRDGPADLLAIAKGQTPPGHAARMRRRELAHRRHLARIRVGEPTVREAVASRIARRIATPRTPREYSDRSAFGRFWWELWDDSWDYATDKRHQRRDNRDAGELPRQRAWRWTRHQARRARKRAGRRAGRRERIHVESQRIWPDPETGDPGFLDVDPEPTDPPSDSPTDPDLTGQEPGSVPVNSEPPDPGGPDHPLELPAPRSDTGPGVTDVPVLTGRAADPFIRKVEVPMEIFNPDSARAAAACLETEAGELIATLDRQAGELDSVNVTGPPRDAYAAMIDAATQLRDAAANAGEAFAAHQGIHDVVHSDESIGDGDYLEVNAR